MCCRYCDKVRIVVFSGSFTQLHWERLQQFGWYCDLDITRLRQGPLVNSPIKLYSLRFMFTVPTIWFLGHSLSYLNYTFWITSDVDDTPFARDLRQFIGSISGCEDIVTNVQFSRLSRHVHVIHCMHGTQLPICVTSLLT